MTRYHGLAAACALALLFSAGGGEDDGGANDPTPDMTTGGGVIGAVCIMVIGTVWIVGGTKVNKGLAGIGEAGTVDEAWARGGPP